MEVRSGKTSVIAKEEEQEPKAMRGTLTLGTK